MKNSTFENDLKRLEEIVKLLENSETPLDKSLLLFEEGIELVKNCNAILDDASQKVKVLSKDYDGSLKEVSIQE